MALSDPFQTVYEGGLKARSTLGENILGIAGLYAKQKEAEKERKDNILLKLLGEGYVPVKDTKYTEEELKKMPLEKLQDLFPKGITQGQGFPENPDVVKVSGVGAFKPSPTSNITMLKHFIDLKNAINKSKPTAFALKKLAESKAYKLSGASAFGGLVTTKQKEDFKKLSGDIYKELLVEFNVSPEEETTQEELLGDNIDLMDMNF